MRDKVRDYICSNQMLAPGDIVVVGVSGGADSVCLLYILSSLAKELSFDIICVHVNHGIRTTAIRDAAYVETLCHSLSVPFIKREIDATRLAKENGVSVEEAGRNARYTIFEEIRRDAVEQRRIPDNSGKIAVAHNRNDQAETVLFNLFRGSNLKGLGGMRPVREHIIRPLLDVERSEIEAYLVQQHMKWQEDETNAELNYTRNRIRHLILPALTKELSLKAVERLADTADEMRETERFLEKLTLDAYADCVKITDGEPEIAAERFLLLDEVIQKRVLYRCMEQLAGSAKDLTNAQVMALSSLFDLQVGKRISLPYRMQAIRTYEGIRLVNATLDSKNDSLYQTILPTIPGTLTDGKQSEWSFELEIWEKNQEITEKKYTKWIDYDKITKCLEIRTRQSGDEIVIGSRGEKKTLKSFFIDEKIPKELRDDMLLLTDGSSIVWIPGYRLSAAYKITEDTLRVLKIHIGGEEEDG